jgi:hypothetical protein
MDSLYELKTYPILDLRALFEEASKCIPATWDDSGEMHIDVIKDVTRAPGSFRSIWKETLTVTMYVSRLDYELFQELNQDTLDAFFTPRNYSESDPCPFQTDCGIFYGATYHRDDMRIAISFWLREAKECFCAEYNPGPCDGRLITICECLPYVCNAHKSRPTLDDNNNSHCRMCGQTYQAGKKRVKR